VVNFFQGDYYVTGRNDEVLTTVLGSCISACIRDAVIGFGGMNHFLLPEDGSLDGGSNLSLRYGSFAMEQLINQVLSHGGRRERLEVKVFGGGNVVKGLSGIGHKNSDFVEKFLKNEGLRLSGCHLRGNLARKIMYIPKTGIVKMRELGAGSARKIHEKETTQSIKTVVDESTGDIELFD